MVKFVQYLRNVIPFLQLPRQMRRLTFYSEGKNYWGYLEPLLTELLALSDVPVCYISSDADDPGLLLVHPNYRKFVIDEGHVRDWLFSNIETDVFVMTMPDLHQYQVKSSRHAVHYVYVQHVPNILETAANGGFQVEVATPSILIKAQESYSQFFFIHRPYDSKTNLQVVIDYQTGFVFDLTFFRSVPKILKELVYNGGRWRLSRLYTPNLGLSFNHHASVHFLADVTHRFMLSEQPGVYKLFHLVTPHAPFVTNSNCGYSEKELDREYMNIYNQTRCALIHLVKLLDKFKSSGIYDSATILVHGDHGIRLPFRDLETDPDDDAREFPHPIGNSNPLLLINPPRWTG